MAYNLDSLITILEQILNPQQKRWLLDDNKPKLQSLLMKASSLKQILENLSLPNMECLDSQIRDASHRAEDMIESCMVDQMFLRARGVSFTFLTPDLQQVIQEIDSVTEQVVELVKMEAEKASLSSVAPSMHGTRFRSIVVGLDGDLLQLKDRLTRRSKLEIVPIVGMGGIGKTTLARKLYQDPIVVEHFDIRVWATISQDYDTRTVLLGLLRRVSRKVVDQQHLDMEKDELKLAMLERLSGRRFLIVVDDLWSVEFWEDVRSCFPDDSNGSRIVLTTRELDVAKDSEKHHMQLLKESESWDLLQQEVFGGEKCHFALESVGRSIARSCGGLPLAVHLIGGLLLSKATDRTHSQQFREDVADDVRRVSVDSDKQFSNILSLSYSHLPSHLKPCFLYMGAFPEDYEIKASRLIRLWIAEGFLRSNGDRSLEEEGEDWLESLVGRNLVSVTALKSNGRTKRFGIHDLVRDLCLQKAEEQGLVHVKNGSKQEPTYCLRRVSVHPSYHVKDRHVSTASTASVRSFLCAGAVASCDALSVVSGLRLLRVLDVLEMKLRQFPTEVLHNANLRYLAFSYTCFSNTPLSLPPFISRLWGLQTLVIRSASTVILPFEIWDITELRHIKIQTGEFLILHNDDGVRRGFLQEKLETISVISNPSDAFLKGIPNIRFLGISTFQSCFSLHNLQRLERLKFSSSSPSPLSSLTLTLPPCLNKLSLKGCNLTSEFMSYLCMLPNLEVLKLQNCKFETGEWDARQQVFERLQFLQLERLRVVRWKADETNFPRLGRLVLRCCSGLDEIPRGIAEIPTLVAIDVDVDECSHSLLASVRLFCNRTTSYVALTPD